MSANLSPEQKRYFTLHAETSLNDLCTIHQYTGEDKNSYNDVTQTFTDIEKVPCGFSYAAVPYQREVNQPVVLQADAVLRVSLEQALSVRDDITVRGKRYHIDSVWDGSTLRIAALKHMETSENG
jgi:hypothetical protein